MNAFSHGHYWTSFQKNSDFLWKSGESPGWGAMTPPTVPLHDLVRTHPLKKPKVSISKTGSGNWARAWLIERALMCLCYLTFQESKKLKCQDSFFLLVHFSSFALTWLRWLPPLSIWKSPFSADGEQGSGKSNGSGNNLPLHSLSYAHTWAPAHLHSSRQSRRTSRSESCNGAEHGTASRLRPPSACCRQSAVPFHSCTHCTDCRSCQLSLRGKKCRHRSLDSKKRWRWKQVLEQGRHICTGVHLHGLWGQKKT